MRRVSKFFVSKGIPFSLVNEVQLLRLIGTGRFG